MLGRKNHYGSRSERGTQAAAWRGAVAQLFAMTGSSRRRATARTYDSPMRCRLEGALAPRRHERPRPGTNDRDHGRSARASRSPTDCSEGRTSPASAMLRRSCELQTAEQRALQKQTSMRASRATCRPRGVSRCGPEDHRTEASALCHPDCSYDHRVTSASSAQRVLLAHPNSPCSGQPLHLSIE